MPKISQLIYGKARSWITALSLYIVNPNCPAFQRFFVFRVKIGNGVCNFLARRVEPGQCFILKSFNRLTLKDQETKQNLQAIGPGVWEEENAISGVIPILPRLSVLIWGSLSCTQYVRPYSPFTRILEIKNLHIEMWLFFELSLFCHLFFYVFHFTFW